MIKIAVSNKNELGVPTPAMTSGSTFSSHQSSQTSEENEKVAELSDVKSKKTRRSSTVGGLIAIRDNLPELTGLHPALSASAAARKKFRGPGGIAGRLSIAINENAGSFLAN